MLNCFPFDIYGILVGAFEKYRSSVFLIIFKCNINYFSNVFSHSDGKLLYTIKEMTKNVDWQGEEGKELET